MHYEIVCIHTRTLYYIFASLCICFCTYLHWYIFANVHEKKQIWPKEDKMHYYTREFFLKVDHVDLLARNKCEMVHS